MGQQIYEDMSDREFLEYLTMVCVDLRESGHDATADDYAECVRRLMYHVRLNEQTIELLESGRL